MVRTIIMAQSARDDHSAISRSVLAMSSVPDIFPWLRFSFGGGVTGSADGGEEVLAAGSLHRLFIVGSHLKLHQQRHVWDHETNLVRGEKLDGNVPR